MAKPYLMSLVMSCLSCSGCFVAPLWLPKANASCRSDLLFSSSSSSSCQSDPRSRMILRRFQKGCFLKSGSRVGGSLNSEPYPSGDDEFASSAALKSKLYFFRTR